MTKFLKWAGEGGGVAHNIILLAVSGTENNSRGRGRETLVPAVPWDLGIEGGPGPSSEPEREGWEPREQRQLRTQVTA